MSLAQNLKFTLLVFATSFVLLFMLGFFVASADETGIPHEETASKSDAAAATEDQQVEQLVAQDENIMPEDLGVGDPAILPGNPLYLFKGAFRTFQTLTTFNPAKKAELKLKFANEKIIEVQKLEKQGVSDERVKSAIDSYEKEVGRVKIEVEKLGVGDKIGKTRTEGIVKQSADNQIKHNKLLGKFMERREAIAPEIEANKAKAMKHFSESMASVVEPEVLQQKYTEVIKEQKGSAFRHFKNIEVLEGVKDFVPEKARGAIQSAIEQSSKFFEKEFRGIEEQERKLFNKYVEKIGGNEVRHLEVFDAINSFADIEKDMFEEMEKAREKSRKRIEHRMKGIEDETRKKVFVAHLEGAKMEDARIVKELENNLAPDTISAVLDIKRKMDQKMREKFEQAESVGDLGSFFDEIENAPDVRMMEVLKEMDEIIPEDKKGFWKEMKKKAMTEMQSGIDQARRFGRLEDEFRQRAGFDPEQMGVLNEFEGEFGPQFDFFEDMRGEQSRRIQGRFENFSEFAEERPEDTDFFERAEEFRMRIQGDPSVQSQIEQFVPQMAQDFRKFDVRREEYGFRAEDINIKIAEAEGFIQKLSSLIDSSTGETPGLDSARTLLGNAKRHLKNAKSALANNNTGEAFGQGVAAVGNATNGIRRLEEGAFKKERGEYFEERDDFRKNFIDLPPEERPDPSEFLKFKPKFFPGLEPPEFDHKKDDEGYEDRYEDRDDKFKDDKFKDEERMCMMVLTAARHITTGKCVVFRNSCIPPGWERVDRCEEKESFIPRFDEQFQFGKEIKPEEHDRQRQTTSGEQPEQERKFFEFPDIGIDPTPFFQPTGEAEKRGSIPLPIPQPTGEAEERGSIPLPIPQPTGGAGERGSIPIPIWKPTGEAGDIGIDPTPMFQPTGEAGEQKFLDQMQEPSTFDATKEFFR